MHQASISIVGLQICVAHKWKVTKAGIQFNESKWERTAVMSRWCIILSTHNLREWGPASASWCYYIKANVHDIGATAEQYEFILINSDAIACNFSSVWTCSWSRDDGLLASSDGIAIGDNWYRPSAQRTISLRYVVMMDGNQLTTSIHGARWNICGMNDRLQACITQPCVHLMLRMGSWVAMCSR